MYVKQVLSLLACLAISLISIANAEEPSARIVGGQIIPVSKAPYIVRIKHINGDHWCGGTIVDSLHVVTAAHCLDFVDPIAELLVVAGVSTLSEAGQERQVVNYYKPADYLRDTFHMDFAVLKLNAAINFGPNARPVQLCTSDMQPGDRVQISGFGRTVGFGQTSPNLRTIFVPTIKYDQCSQSFNLTNTMFCVASIGQGPCQYDSGGPLVYGGELCGIVSWGRSDCNYSNGSPAVFTHVKAIRPLIQNAINSL